MYNQQANTGMNSTEVMDIFRNSFEEGSFIVTESELSSLIDSVRDENGNVVFEIENGNELVFEMYGNIHRVNLILRSEYSGY